MLKKYLFILVTFLLLFLKIIEASQKVDSLKNKKSSKTKK